MDQQCQSPQLWSQSFMTSLILNTNFIKQELKIGYPQVSNEDLPDWEPTVITTTLYVTAAYEQGGIENPVGESYR